VVVRQVPRVPFSIFSVIQENLTENGSRSQEASQTLKCAETLDVGQTWWSFRTSTKLWPA